MGKEGGRKSRRGVAKHFPTPQVALVDVEAPDLGIYRLHTMPRGERGRWMCTST